MRTPDRLVLWRPNERQWGEARRRGMANVPWGEYLARLRVAAREARRGGVPVVYCRATPAQVAAALEARGMTNTPDNRAAIYILLVDEMRRP